MGTVWVFRPTEKLKFHDLCLSRMVERFGQDETNWEHIILDFMTIQGVIFSYFLGFMKVMVSITMSY